MPTWKIILIAFISTLALVAVLIGAGSPMWAVVVLGAFALIEGITLIVIGLGGRHGKE